MDPFLGPARLRAQSAAFHSRHAADEEARHREQHNPARGCQPRDGEPFFALRRTCWRSYGGGLRLANRGCSGRRTRRLLLVWETNWPCNRQAGIICWAGSGGNLIPRAC